MEHSRQRVPKLGVRFLQLLDWSPPDDPLVYWSIGPLVNWSIGPLVECKMSNVICHMSIVKCQKLNVKYQ